jgi:hypothetical protein
LDAEGGTIVRTIIIAAVILLALAGVAVALSRPQVADPGPPVVLDSPAASPASGGSHDADHDDATEDRDAKAGKDDADHDSDDQFDVAQPKPVKADGDDWDDDDAYDVEDDSDADDANDVEDDSDADDARDTDD